MPPPPPPPLVPYRRYGYDVNVLHIQLNTVTTDRTLLNSVYYFHAAFCLLQRFH